MSVERPNQPPGSEVVEGECFVIGLPERPTDNVPAIREPTAVERRRVREASGEPVVINPARINVSSLDRWSNGK